VGNPYHQVARPGNTERVLALASAVAPFALFVAVYAPAMGHGFVRDDYTWILRSRIGSFQDLLRLLSTDLGFYRPVVGLTFAVDRWLFGATPAGYGVTNLLLALGCCAGIAALARALGLPRGAAVLAGAIWLVSMNFMPIGVLWISGRTALLMILAATLSTAALLRGRLWPSIAWLVVALFSKEEAVLLPFVLMAWVLVLPRVPVSRSRWVIAAIAVLAMYFLARAYSGATNPANAPPFYRFTFDAGTVVANLGWYLVQATALPAMVVAAAAIVLGLSRLDAGPEGPAHSDVPDAGPEGPAYTDPSYPLTRLILCSLFWIAGGLALTIWLPVRSHLYIALPAVGAALGAAALCSHWWALSTPTGQRVALASAIAIVVMLAPIHFRKTREWVTRTTFAAVALRDLDELTASLPDGAQVMLADNRNDPHGNLASVFGTMANEAVELASGRPLEVWIDPPPPHADVMGLRAPCTGCVRTRLSLVEGRLRPPPSP
jgi:hypothetical protein